MRVAIISVLTVGLSAIFFGLLCKALEIPSRYRMVKYGARADGWITAKEPHEHGGLVVYSFKVDYGTYRGEGGIGDNFETAKVGDRVSVIYDPANPTVSTLGKPKEQLWQTVAMSIFVALLCGILGTAFLTFVWYHWRRTRG